MLAGLLLAVCSRAFALNPALDVSQYAHTAWRYRDGFTKGEIYNIAQTSDGYLWLATGFGIYRFDGVRALPWQPPPDTPLPSKEILHLLPARDGTLWIGTRMGLASWQNGKLKVYAELAGLSIFALIEDHEGSVWVGAYGIPAGKLCDIQKGNVRCHPEIGGLGNGVMGLQEDAKGNLWVGLATGVWRWKPGPSEFYGLQQPNGVQFMASGEDGGLLISTPEGLRGLVNQELHLKYPIPSKHPPTSAGRILRDRDGGLWLATRGTGIVHWRPGRADLFSEIDGLSSDTVASLFEDREGNIWAATRSGLDRFREYAAVSYTAKQGVPDTFTVAVLAAKDGSVWFSGNAALARLHQGQLTVYGEYSPPAGVSMPVRVVRGQTIGTSGALTQDSRGRIWIASRTATGYLENDRFVAAAVPSGISTTIHQDSAGNMWIASLALGVVKLSPQNHVERFAWDSFRHKDPVTILTADPARGGEWLGFFSGGIAHFLDGRVVESYSAADGLGAGRVNSLWFDQHGALWAATEGGLSRLRDGRIATLNTGNGLPCDAVHWIVEDDMQSVWLGMPCGLARIALAERSAWEASPNPAGQKIHATLFDRSDGVVGTAGSGAQNPHAAKALDGRIWFPGEDGLGVIDPRHLPVNHLPPPVAIEQIVADGKTYSTASHSGLPALSHELEIDYTALSLTAPEKIQFKYKLEGHDADWQDAGNRRQAFYNDLPPRHYRFRVIAANNSGVWNEAGASLDFSIAPAYYQTAWFRALIAVVVLASLAGLYQLRLGYLKHQFQIRLEARVGERTRIARDFHDTLLQSFQAVLFKFYAVKHMIRVRPEEAEETLERILEQARAAITEGRDAIQGLRSSMIVANDLARAITTFAQGLAGDGAGQQGPEFCLNVEGESRDLPPLVREEVYQIACESLRNAFRHAQAPRIEVQIRYDSRRFRLHIVDNGKGIDAAVLSAGGLAGHHGLPGLRERAELAGGKLSIWSQLHSGTEIELTIPAAIAYLKPPPARQSMISGEGAG